MRARQILCPSCGMLLDVPPGKSDCFVRCGGCQHRFRLPKRIAVTEDAIADWIGEGREGEVQHAAERTLQHRRGRRSLDALAQHLDGLVRPVRPNPVNTSSAIKRTSLAAHSSRNRRRRSMG